MTELPVRIKDAIHHLLVRAYVDGLVHQATTQATSDLIHDIEVWAEELVKRAKPTEMEEMG